MEIHLITLEAKIEKHFNILLHFLKKILYKKILNKALVSIIL